MRKNQHQINGWRSAVQGWHDFEKGAKRSGLTPMGFSNAQSDPDSDNFEVCAWGVVNRGLQSAFPYPAHRNLASEILGDVIVRGFLATDQERFGDGWSEMIETTLIECEKFITEEVVLFNRGKNPK